MVALVAMVEEMVVEGKTVGLGVAAEVAMEREEVTLQIS